MSFDFPASPTENQMFQAPGGPRYVYSNGGWRMSDPGPPGTAQTRNRIVNGAMQVSQENGRNSVFPSGSYPADQWVYTYSGPTGVSTNSGVGPPNYIRMWSAGGIASPTAGQYAILETAIEGIRMADFLWGTAGALPAVLRFKARTSGAAPTLVFGVGLRGTGNRSFVRNFTATGAWAEYTMPIIGDTTGTWAIDNTRSLGIAFVGMSGSSFLTAPGVWTAGNFLAATGVGNLYTTTGQGLDIADVGLYLDPLATGVAPRWEMPDEADELLACQRYFYSGVPPARGAAGTAANTASRLGCAHPVRMRVTPALAGFLTMPVFDGAVVGTITGIATQGNAAVLEFDVTLNTTYAAGRAIVLHQSGGNVSVSARM